jgi:DNA repair photolyase
MDKIKPFNGKAIYQPAGRAAEYAKWACNFYIGCSNDCTYCYCKRFKWGNVPTLKKCFKSNVRASEIFEKELHANLPELQKHGLFFSFSTDPMLQKTECLTWCAINNCNANHVPVAILTKCTGWVDDFIEAYHQGLRNPKNWSGRIAFGFTLTGHDELEPNASTNAERIKAMKKLHEKGFITWASIEPIINLESSYEMIIQTLKFCNLYKIGLESGKKYDKKELLHFIDLIIGYLPKAYEDATISFPKIYFKDSLLQQAGINREDLPSICVTNDYNIFNN